MTSRRGRLNWSNLEIHISDDVIDKQHHFTSHHAVASASASIENIKEDENETDSTAPPPPVKRSWMPKAGVGDIQAEQFVGNFMLTNAEQTAINHRYGNKQESHADYSKNLPVSKRIQISTRLPSVKEIPSSLGTSSLSVGQHLLNVFVCHVESHSRIYIMYGDEFNRATKLFQDMNICDELVRPLSIVFVPRENDLVAIYHEKKWFRGRCLGSADANVNVLCIDSGVIITCSPADLRRLPDPSMPDTINTACFELLYKDRYEAIVTRLETPTRPTIVLYYGDENVNDQLLAILKLI